MMAFSDRCRDLSTYFDNDLSECVMCSVRPGYAVTPNCGIDDEGNHHEPPFTACKANTFNDGSGAYCLPCASCPPGFIMTSPCSATSDTICKDPGSGATGTPAGQPTTSQFVANFFSTVPTTQTNQGSILKPNPTSTIIFSSESDNHVVALQWAVPLVILISIILFVIFAYLIYMKQRRGLDIVLNYRRGSSYINAGFSPLVAPPGNNDLEHMLGPDILSAPLQTVLDNLDVLEELVILLDPEIQGVKNTKHLASHCSFPATWITYTYSMKDSKSPLKAVLEGVTSRNPDWTVGHLAKLLKHMERIDAIAALAKLRENVMQV